MTPDELRKWVDRIYNESYADDVGFCLMAEEKEFVHAAADAWDRDRITLMNLRGECERLRKRLEVANKALRAIVKEIDSDYEEHSAPRAQYIARVALAGEEKP